MDVVFFLQIVAAVVVAIAACAGFAYAAWRIRRAERIFNVKDGADMVPTKVILLLIPPPAIVAIAAYLLR